MSYPQPCYGVGMRDKMTKIGEREYSEWELDSKVRTLQEAREIEADAPLMVALLPRMDKAVESVKGLQKLRAKAKALKASGK